MNAGWICPGARTFSEEGVSAAYLIKEEVKQKTGLTISCGVSFNKTMAKLGSDLKKPDAVTVLDKNDWQKHVYPLPVSALMGVWRQHL